MEMGIYAMFRVSQVKILNPKPCVLLFRRNLVRPRASESELSVNTTSRVPYNRLDICPNR